jgi:hypothetical protein
MADLVNDGGSLRFVLLLAGREGAPPGAPAAAATGRLLAGGGMEYLDHADREWWPILRLSSLYVSAAGVERLCAELRDVLQGSVPGVSWRDDEGALGLQVGVEQGGAVIEVGLDVGRFLADAGGAALRPGSELALFRFRARQDALVRFAGALAAEVQELAR